MVNRRHFLKLFLGVGAVGAGYGTLRTELPPATLGQATFEVAVPDPVDGAPLAITTSAQPVVEVRPFELEVIPRESWGAAPVVGTFVEHTITRITVHHTGSKLEDNSNAPGRIRQHQAFHQVDRGWPDIAYHYIVDRNGHVYEGRPVWAAGDTGTDYDPTGHFLVCCEGNFDEQAPSDSQLAAVSALIAWGSTRYSVGLDTVLGHRDVASTSCPGDRLYAGMERLIESANGFPSEGGVILATLTDNSGFAVVAGIETGRL